MTAAFSKTAPIQHVELLDAVDAAVDPVVVTVILAGAKAGWALMSLAIKKLG